jgi:hypothetical protein
MWVIVIVVIRFTSWVETKTFDFVATSHEEETVRSWSDTLMIIIGAVSEQGAILSLIQTYAFQTVSCNAMWSIIPLRLNSIQCEISGSAGIEYLPLNVKAGVLYISRFRRNLLPQFSALSFRNSFN